MGRLSTFLTGSLLALVLFSFLGCASGPRGELKRVEKPTEAELRQNWDEYTIYYRRNLALIYKIKDDSRIELDGSWIEVTSEGMMEKAEIIDTAWVREILGQNNKKFGYLVHRYLDDAYAGIIDDNTVRLVYYYHKTTGR